MAQTKRKRHTKHRGNAGGVVEARGRTGRPPSADEKKRGTRDTRREERLNRKPTWKSSGLKGLACGAFMFVFLLFFNHTKGGSKLLGAVVFAGAATLLYVGLAYYTDMFMWRRRMAEKSGRIAAMIDVRAFTVGPVQENCYFVRRPNAVSAVVVDPGDEAPRLMEALRQLGIESVEAILLTHCHFDHVGAVKAIHDATGAPVWCPELETELLANINAYTFPGFGPFDNYDADHTVSGGETLELAGLTFDVRFTPGHSPGHVTYAVRDEQALLSGDVLFQGSVGRTDLPGGDWPTLLASIEALIDEFPGESRVYPGHMGVTTLADERSTNPFLRELSHHS